MGRLDGKVALISGGARGLGAAEAQLFAREGAKVVIGDILDEPGAEVERLIRESGGEARYTHLDVTSAVDWKRAVDLAEATFGHLHILVNNAGVPLRRSLEDTSEEEWDLVLAVNLKGTFLGTKVALPALRRAGGGSIVNTSSAAGIVASGSAAYGASKGGVRALTKTTAMLYAKEGIRCNSIHPGPVDTEVNREAQQNAQAWEQRLQAVPMGRIALPDEIAFGVLYLASDEASYTTGSELVIDGGSVAV